MSKNKATTTYKASGRAQLCNLGLFLGLALAAFIIAPHLANHSIRKDKADEGATV